MILERALRWRWTSATVLAAAFLVRAVWALTLPDRFLFPDSGRYDIVARRLLDGEGFVVHTGYPFLPRELQGRGYLAHSPPGYSVFLAGLYAVGLDSALAVRLVQALLGTATVWLVMLLARSMFGRNAALLAGAVAAFEPHLVFFSGLVLTETVGTLLLTASLVFLVRTAREAGGRRYRAAAAWGALVGAVTLVRSGFLLFLPISAAADVLFARRDERRSRLKAELLALGVFALVMAPWTIRNAVRLGAFVPGATNLGIALHVSLGPGAHGGWDTGRIGWPEDELRPLGEVERDRFLRREALARAVAHPIRSALLAVVNEVHLWSPVPWAEHYRTPLYWTVGGVSFLLLVAAAALGAALRRREWRTWWPALAPAGYLTMLTLMIAGSVRYRVPAHAALAVLAGAGYASLVKRLDARAAGSEESHT